MPQIVITDSASDVLFIFFGTKTILYSFLTPLNPLFTKGFLYYEIFRNDFFRNTTYPRIRTSESTKKIISQQSGFRKIKA